MQDVQNGNVDSVRGNLCLSVRMEAFRENANVLFYFKSNKKCCGGLEQS